MNKSGRDAASMGKVWSKPELKRLDAGSAENRNVNARDGGTSPGTAQS